MRRRLRSAMVAVDAALFDAHRGTSTVRRYVTSWPSPGGLALYLACRCATGYREGRRVHTGIRLGSWSVVGRSRDGLCPHAACDGEEDSVEHWLWHCPSVAAQHRAAFVAAMERLHPGFMALADAARTAALAAASPAPGVRVCVYRYLALALAARRQLRS